MEKSLKEKSSMEFEKIEIPIRKQKKKRRHRNIVKAINMKARKKICYHTKWTIQELDVEALYDCDALVMLLEEMAAQLKLDVAPEEYNATKQYIDSLKEKFDNYNED